MAIVITAMPTDNWAYTHQQLIIVAARVSLIAGRRKEKRPASLQAFVLFVVVADLNRWTKDI